jgi:membrane-associated protease RseP (regulator of RpoE activity)
MIVHEGAHGVIARSLGLPVKASGLIFILFVIPIGAFVDVDEDALKVAKSSHAGRVLAAGAGVNLVLAVVCLLLLFSAVGNLRPKVDGIAVGSINPGYPAAQAGIRPGDFITAVNGIPIDSSAAVNGSSWYRIGQSVNITVWRDGEYLQFNQVVIGSYPVNDTRTGIVSQRPIIGFGGVDYSTLTGMVSTYSGSFFSRALYFDIPTLPIAQGVVPFGDSTAAFYTSSIGSSLVPLLDLLYWIFFLNFNLAIFNSLPLYPLDGGQAFMVGLKALGGGKLSEESLGRLTTAASLIVLGIILLVVAGPYLI